MTPSQLAEAIGAGRRVYGTCVVSPAPQWPTMIASTGVDFVFLDTEHIVLDRTELAWMCQAYAGHGLAPLVRIPSPDPTRASQVIDAGAAGVIAPYIESVADVQQLVGAVKLRPLKGRRLFEALTDRRPVPSEVLKYLDEYNRDRLCIINIESVPALESLDELLAVPGLDALLIGPHDLSINLGIPEQYHHPQFEDAVQTVIRKGRAAGVSVGMHYSDGVKELVAWARAGLNLMIHASDLRIVSRGLTADIATMRAELDGSSVEAEKTSKQAI
jgi:4-hydroxy-2-oxoheptanedioate aldolase